MNLSNKIRKEIILLTESFLEGTLDDTAAARLDDLVANDPEAARFYLKYIELHGELHQIYEGRTPSAPSTPLLPDLYGNSGDDPLSSPEDRKPSTGMGPTGPILGWFGVIGITLVMSVLVVVTLWWGAEQKPCKPGAQKLQIAQVTAASDCFWSANSDAEVDAVLGLGDRVALEQGTAEITYDTGVKVWIQGPVSYVISDTNRGLLEEGEISASVPPEAIGFVVDTPAGEIIDQGTEFDVKVRKDTNSGETTADVRVIRGAVDVNLPHGQAEDQGANRFTSGEAVRMSSLQRQEAKQTLPEEDLFDPRTIKGLRLWLRADAAVMRDDQGRIKEMIDLVGGSNKTVENFRQLDKNKRPMWMDRVLNERSALTFTGRQYLQLPDKSDLSFDKESLTIFVVGKASDHTQYFVSSASTKSKRAAGNGFRFTTSRDCGLRYWAGTSAKMVRPCPITRPNVLTVVHDRRVSGSNTITLFCNGRQLGRTESVPDSNIENAYPLTIGANPEAMDIYPHSSQNCLHGDLAEILIFGRVLTELEQQRIENYLQTRYGLENEPPKME